MTPPKPASRPARVSLWQHLRLFRRDILSAQPAHLYRAWMAEFRTPFFRSYLCNDPALVGRILKSDFDDFPKSDRVREGLAPLLGRSIFVTNHDEWARQRRIIAPAFEGGRLHETFPAMLSSAHALRARLLARVGEKVEIEEMASQGAADVILRALFSLPIEDETAQRVFMAFRTYQRAQPLVNIAAFIPLPRWMPRFHSRAVRRGAAEIRSLLGRLTEERFAALDAGSAPDDLATKLIQARDPETGRGFSPSELADQIAIFFLAGHETSASALSWALYLLATHPEIQARARAEAASLPDVPSFGEVMRLRLIRDIFRETLRLYPPVPMMVRENRCPVHFRGRNIAPRAQMVISPWHMHRHERLWSAPDEFDPDRWQTQENREPAQDAYIPFSSGPRVCPGAGFAMTEGMLFLAVLLRSLTFGTGDSPAPVPVAHLTVRSLSGMYIWTGRV